MTCGPTAGSALASPPRATVAAFWRQAAEAHADLPAVRKGDAAPTFRDLDRRSAALARGLLAEGVGKGARVGILMSNGPDWVAAWLAVNRIGAIAITLSTFFTARELAYAVTHADVAVLLSDVRLLRHDYVARLEEAFPNLAGADGRRALMLPECPFLRSVWFTDDVDPSWAGGALRDLEQRGEASPVDLKMLRAVEEAVSPADLAMVVYTSGSTADPKGVMHTQGAMVRKAVYMARSNWLIPANLARGDHPVVTQPFFWIGGFLILCGALAHGACVVCVDDHSPQSLLRAVRETAATHLGASEAVIRSIQALPEFRENDLDLLKPLSTSQRPIFARDSVERALIPRSLGMTETFGPHSGGPDGSLLPEGAEGSAGPALEGVEYKIIDPATGEPAPFGQPGELFVRAPWLMEGMYKKERREVFDKDGWYGTGDECVLRRDGYLFFRSRIGGMIKTSGANVSPEEVERVLRAQPDVVEATVVGVPNPKLGEMVVAAVVKRRGSELDEAALQAALKDQLSSFKVPKRILFFDLEELPRTPSNKVRKSALAKMIATGRPPADAAGRPEPRPSAKA